MAKRWKAIALLNQQDTNEKGGTWCRPTLFPLIGFEFGHVLGQRPQCLVEFHIPVDGFYRSSAHMAYPTVGPFLGS